MVKIFKILFMLFLFPLSVWAQETEVVFKGIVTNTEGIGIANVLCKALVPRIPYWLMVSPKATDIFICNTRRM